MKTGGARSAGTGTKPLAVALLGTRPHTTVSRWRAGRAELTRRARDSGYRLLEIFDITGDTATDVAMYAAVEALADRTGAHTFLVHDVADPGPVHALADRLGARVVQTVEQYRPGSEAARLRSDVQDGLVSDQTGSRQDGRDDEPRPDEVPDTLEVDVVVIGGGPAGENVAGRVRRGDLSVVLVESELFGGECSYWACMPSKALLRPVELHAAARRLPGLHVGPIDAAAVLRRRDDFTSHHDDTGQEEWVRGVGAVPLRGRARLDGERRVVVHRAGGGSTVITARHAVVLAVGSDAAVPPVPGLREAAPWTSREVTNAEAVPRRLVVLGGGVVACEMAQAMRGLGAQEVTVVERGDRLLGRLAPIAGRLLGEAFAEAGIRVETGSGLVSVERPVPGGEVTATLASGQRLVADEIVVATGRRPRTDGLGLDTVGLTGDRLARGGYVPVDDGLAVQGVGGGWLYAVGDVNGRSLLTHMGKYQGRVVGELIVARAAGLPDDGPGMRARADGLGAPAVVFTDPQVASVGRTEDEAREAGLRVRTVEYDIASVAGASLLADRYRGRASMVVDEDRRVVVGATFVGQDVAELLHSATVAVVGEVPLDVLWHAVPSYPTVSEVWLRLMEEYGL